MSFSRLAYDNTAYKQELSQSVGPSQYVLNTPWRQCAPCLSTNSGQPSGQAVSTCISRAMIDVDSELQGITRKATRNCNAMHKPSDVPFCQQSTQVVDCSDKNRSEDTRLSNPPCTLRSTGFNRWEWLCQNPQDRIEMPFDTMINSQLIVRDTHRPILPTLFDPSLALPPDEDAKIHESAKAMCGTLKTNLPMVSWRNCDEINRY